MIGKQIIFFTLLFACSSIYSNDLGSGKKGLTITVHRTLIGPYTFTISIDQHPVNEIDRPYIKGRDLLVHQEKLQNIDMKYWSTFMHSYLFSFDSESAIDSNINGNLYRLHNGQLTVYPGKGLEEARKVYGLNVHEQFLGRLTDRIFYLNKDDNKIYYFDLNKVPARWELKIPSRIKTPYGIAFGSNPDSVSVFAMAKSPWLSVAPYTTKWFDVHY